jgi:hypothetical protein
MSFIVSRDSDTATNNVNEAVRHLPEDDSFRMSTFLAQDLLFIARQILKTSADDEPQWSQVIDTARLIAERMDAIDMSKKVIPIRGVPEEGQ